MKTAFFLFCTVAVRWESSPPRSDSLVTRTLVVILRSFAISCFLLRKCNAKTTVFFVRIKRRLEKVWSDLELGDLKMTLKQLDLQDIEWRIGSKTIAIKLVLLKQIEFDGVAQHWPVGTLPPAYLLLQMKVCWIRVRAHARLLLLPRPTCWQTHSLGCSLQIAPMRASAISDAWENIQVCFPVSSVFLAIIRLKKCVNSSAQHYTTI